MPEQILVSIYVRRDQHENGMTLQEYADGVVAGTHPILDHDQFVYQFGAIEDELNLVAAWAEANRLSVVESHTGMAVVKTLGTTEQYNQLFGITLETVVDGDRTYHTHAGDLVIPSEINDVVDAVLGLDNSIGFTHNAILDENHINGDLDSNVIFNPTPVDLALAYKFPRAPGSDLVQGKGTCVAIIELGGGWTTQNLTSTFGRIGQPNPTVVDVLIDGGVNNPSDTGSSGEVMLDIYCVGAVAPAAKIAMYFAPNTFQGFVDQIAYCANDTVNKPSVLSISWGTNDTYFGSYLTAMDNAFRACLVKGVTTFVASGDYGVKAISTATTYTLNHPSTSPYVVAAGGTVISINNDYTIASEVPWGTSGGSFAGGGGVSTIYPVPNWQTGFSSKLYPGGTVAALTGRGTPDVSAMATGYTFYYGAPNYLGTFLGTSATAPLLGGMMARLNSLTGRRIGFVNSDWYGLINSAFNDMTSGDNHGGNTVGYMATPGWDACTGLGTPIGTEIYKFYKKGGTSIFPKSGYGNRPSKGQTYPRRASGVR